MSLDRRGPAAVIALGCFWRLNGMFYFHVTFTALPVLNISPSNILISSTHIFTYYKYTSRTLNSHYSLNSLHHKHRGQSQNIHTRHQLLIAGRFLYFQNLSCLKVCQILLSGKESHSRSISHHVCHHLQAIRITYMQRWLSSHSCLLHLFETPDCGWPMSPLWTHPVCWMFSVQDVNVSMSLIWLSQNSHYLYISLLWKYVSLQKCLNC